MNRPEKLHFFVPSLPLAAPNLPHREA